MRRCRSSWATKGEGAVSRSLAPLLASDSLPSLTVGHKSTVDAQRREETVDRVTSRAVPLPGQPGQAGPTRCRHRCFYLRGLRARSLGPVLSDRRNGAHNAPRPPVIIIVVVVVIVIRARSASEAAARKILNPGLQVSSSTDS